MEETKKPNQVSVSAEINNEEKEKTDPIVGTVIDCKNLNIRKEPSLDSNVVQIVEHGSELMVDESDSTEEFYKVYTASGAEGYCVKKFVKTE